MPSYGVAALLHKACVASMLLIMVPELCGPDGTGTRVAGDREGRISALNYLTAN
jgi:hypothetical protein